MTSSEGGVAPSGATAVADGAAAFPVEYLARGLVALFALGVRDRAAYSELLRNVLVARADLLAAWTLWEPEMLDARDDEFRNAPGHDSTGRFMACWHRAEGEPRLAPVVGYEERGRGDWYWVPKQSVRACAVEPIYYPLGERWVWLTSQVAPILVGDRLLGLAGLDFPADELVARQHLRADRDGGTRIAPLRDDPLSRLTGRELEVVHWLRQGKTNLEIGIILGISGHTVKNHVYRIFRKLRVNNRYEAITEEAG